MPNAEYVADDLIESAKLRGALSIGTFDPIDFYRIATDEMRSDLVPLILSAREDYFTTYTDYTPTVDPSDGTGQTMGPFRLPSRAVANKARLVQLLNANGSPIEVGRVPLEAVPYERIGFYVRGSSVYVINQSGTPYSAVRIHYHLRTGSLVPIANVWFVTGMDPVTRTVDVTGLSYVASTRILLPVAKLPVSGSFDFTRTEPPFDTIAFDRIASASGVTLTFADALPASLALYDQVSLAGQSAVVTLPVEFHSVLAQAVAAKCLETEGDAQGLAMAQAKLNAMKGDALKLITNRAEGNPKLIVNVRSPFRRWY